MLFGSDFDVQAAVLLVFCMPAVLGVGVLMINLLLGFPLKKPVFYVLCFTSVALGIGLVGSQLDYQWVKTADVWVVTEEAGEIIKTEYHLLGSSWLGLNGETSVLLSANNDHLIYNHTSQTLRIEDVNYRDDAYGKAMDEGMAALMASLSEEELAELAARIVVPQPTVIATETLHREAYRVDYFGFDEECPPESIASVSIQAEQRWLLWDNTGTN